MSLCSLRMNVMNSHLKFQVGILNLKKELLGILEYWYTNSAHQE